MLCPKCNQPVADGVRFCGSCGQPLSPASSPDATAIRPGHGPVPAAGAASSGGGVVPPGTGAPPGGYSTDPSTPGARPFAGATGAGLIERIKNILLSPKTEWPVIEREPTSIAQLYSGYVVWLAAFAAVMQFIRMSVIGVSIGFGTFRTPLVGGLLYAVVHFVFILIMLYILGLIVDALAPTFAGQRDRRQALKAVGYVLTPGAVAAVFGLLPGIGGLLELLAGLYGIYLLYLGLPVMMRSPQDKAIGYTAAVIICGILVGVVLGVLLAVVGRVTGMGSYYGLGGYSSYGALTPEQRQEQAAANLGAVINGLAKAGEQAAARQQAAAANTAAQAGASTDAAANAAAANAQGTAGSAQAAAATAGILAAMGNAASGGQHVEPVDFHVLKGLLPDSLPGMQRTNAEGESNGAMGMKASSASGSYQGQGTSAEIKIVDASAVAGLLNMATAVAANASSESDSGFEKNTTVGGRMVHEKYDIRSKRGEVTAIVANRFTVEVTGNGLDMGTIEQYAALVDYSKLESMKDAGAQR
jgi:hypothetical protein